MLALANVASAAPSAEDQYVERPPTGTGTTPGGTIPLVDTDGDGVITEDEVEDAAKKKKKKAKPKAKEGATGGTGAAGSATGTPPSSSSPVSTTATATKIGPFSTTTAALLGVMALGLGGLGAFMHFRPPVPGP